METRFGFIHEKIDIKIVILFILKRLPRAVDFNSLAELVTQCDDGIGYFDFSDCISELVATGHVEDGKKGYKITEKGIKINKITESGLPYSVRVKAEKIASKASEAQRRDAMIRTSHEAKPRGGIMVKLAMSDGFGDVIRLDLLAANEQQSLRIEDHFRQNAEEIYLKLVQMLTSGDI